jgi:hypothetical protein
LLSWLLNANGLQRDSRNITRANVGDWSAGHPAVIASATYCAQPLGTVVVGAGGNVGAMLIRVVVICTPGCIFGSGAALASHNNVKAAKPLINHAPILIAK